MLKKLCTLVVLALAVSPFSAPFGTCDTPQILSLVVNGENEPSSLVAPLPTAAGRLKVAPPMGIVVVSLVVAAPPVTLITPSNAPTSGLSDRSPLSTILRR
jgi:hypothetical protein